MPDNDISDTSFSNSSFFSPEPPTDIEIIKNVVYPLSPKIIIQQRQQQYFSTSFSDSTPPSSRERKSTSSESSGSTLKGCRPFNETTVQSNFVSDSEGAVTLTLPKVIMSDEVIDALKSFSLCVEPKIAAPLKILVDFLSKCLHTNKCEKITNQKIQIEFWPNTGIIVDYHDLVNITAFWKKNPRELVRRLLVLILGYENVKYYTATGKSGSEKIPTVIFESIFKFVNANVKKTF